MGGMALSRFDAGVRLRAATERAIVALFHETDPRLTPERVFEISRLLIARSIERLDRQSKVDCAAISISVLSAMRAWRILVPVLLIGATAFAVETRLPFKTIFKGEGQFNRLVSLAKENNWKSLPIGEAP